MEGMQAAVSRIMDALHAQETVAVWSDYDCDGVPGGALMADFFRSIGYPIVSYIPERSEGYGLNKDGILQLHEEGVTLIITVDCGITAIDEVLFAKEHGVEVIITDHHLPRIEEAIQGEAQELLPNAVAVLNPHRAACTYPFKELCGTGVAFKLVEALIKKNSDVGCRYFSFSEGQEKWLLDLVALATVADMVPLVGENRTLVHYGLVVLGKGRRKGLKALLEKMRVPLEYLTEDDISFSIAPKINAASRMKSPRLALELLTTSEEARAKEIAKELVQLNDARKLEGARVAKEVKHRLEGTTPGDVIVLGNPDWKPALLGIAATNIVETYQRPVCLWGKDGDLIKGSCRSDGSVNIVSLMTQASDVFEEFGGHEHSGGFSVKHDAIHTLQEVLTRVYAKVHNGATQENNTTPDADITLTISELNQSAYSALRTLAPYGVGNRKPLFALEKVRIEKMIYFGAHKEHIRLSMSDDSARTIEAISFFVQRNAFKETVGLLSVGDYVRIVGPFELSVFGSKKEFRLRIEDIALHTEAVSSVPHTA